METPSPEKEKPELIKNAAPRPGENFVLEKSLILRKVLQFFGQFWLPDRKRLPLFRIAYSKSSDNQRSFILIMQFGHYLIDELIHLTKS